MDSPQEGLFQSATPLLQKPFQETRELVLPYKGSRIKTLEAGAACQQCRENGITECHEVWHKDAALRCLRCARLEVICTYTYENNQLYSSDPRIQQSLSEVIEGRIAPLLQDLPAIFKLYGWSQKLQQEDTIRFFNDALERAIIPKDEMPFLKDLASNRLKKLHALSARLCRLVAEFQALYN
ncbi:hypothetical protein BC629DRAFT_1444990 [Irpex lacteus]|nr:hypothetical protein BC629DRAFT_1444990 [Irpex lacteus]